MMETSGTPANEIIPTVLATLTRFNQIWLSKTIQVANTSRNFLKYGNKVSCSV